MSMHNELLVYGILGIIVFMATVPLVALRTKEWFASASGTKIKKDGLITHFSLIMLSLSLVGLGLMARPSVAKELFVLPANGGYEFYVVEPSLEKPSLSLTAPRESTWPGLENSRLNDDMTFMDSRFKKSSLVVDPGFRTSLTNRIVTVAGRIDWVHPLGHINVASQLEEIATQNLAQQNLERLTGTRLIAWQITPDASVRGYN